jgi:hypothetical protein
MWTTADTRRHNLHSRGDVRFEVFTAVTMKNIPVGIRSVDWRKLSVIPLLHIFMNFGPCVGILFCTMMSLPPTFRLSRNGKGAYGLEITGFC